MINPSKRGAARVPVVWLVVFLVGFLVAFGIAFAGFDEAATYKKSYEDAVNDKALIETRLTERQAEVRSISEHVGWYDETAASPRTQVEALQSGLEQAKGVLPDMGPNVKDLQDVIERYIPAYNARVREVADLKARVSQLENEVSTKTQAMADLTQEKDGRIRDLQQQLSDAEQAAQSRQNDLENEVASVRSSLSDTERQLSQARTETDDARRAADEKAQRDLTRMREMSSKLEFLREPEQPDGELLAVSKDLGLGWIDLGQNNRLFRGMRFRVVSGEAGAKRVKAWCEVLKVEDEMAEVLIYDRADQFDPPVPGDVIYNPIYDPVGIRNAVVVGRFSGTYNEKDLRALLGEIRIHVQPKLDKTTDYLIVGSEMYYDEEGEPLEEPVQPSDTTVYKEAVAMGVQIVPLKQVRDYFRRYDS